MEEVDLLRYNEPNWETFHLLYEFERLFFQHNGNFITIPSIVPSQVASHLLKIMFRLSEQGKKAVHFSHKLA